MGGRYVALALGALALFGAGCGKPGKPMVFSPDERAVYGTPAERAAGYGPGKARHWPPACEAAWTKLLDPARGENHVVALEWGVNGPQVYDAYALVWGATGPFRTVRAHLPYKDDQNPRFLEGELPRDEGEALLETIGSLDPLRLTPDATQAGKVFGAGKVLFHVQIASRQNEFEVVAPYRLAKGPGGDPRPRNILLTLLEAVPGQKN